MSKLYGLTPALNMERDRQTRDRGPLIRANGNQKGDGHRDKTKEWWITDERRNRKLAMQGHSPNWKAGLRGSGLMKLSGQH